MGAARSRYRRTEFLPFPIAWAYSPTVLRFSRPPLSLIVFLVAIVGVGAAFGHALDSAGVAAFLLFVASIDGKPAWKFWFDPKKAANDRESMARGARPAPRAVPNKRFGERP
jgi:hypothetical protein